MSEIKITTSTEYEYRGLLANTWDLFRGDTSGWPDRAFYLELIHKHGEPVLDVGCGTGRLLLDYLGQGLDVDGVDNSPDMLALCRQKAADMGLSPDLYEQGMETLDIPRTYRTIIVPSLSFQLVTDLDQARQAMGRFYDHLEPGGLLAMPFWVMWEPGDPKERDWFRVSEETDPENGDTYRRWVADWFDDANQLEHTENRFEIVREGEVIASELHVRSPATRWYTQDQAKELYLEAGFTNLKLLKTATWEPAAVDDIHFTVLGYRP